MREELERLKLRIAALPAAQRKLAPLLLLGYTRAEADALCSHAEREGLILVTTEKDLARIKDDTEVTELAALAHALPVTLALDDETAFKTLVLERVKAARNADCG